MKPTFAVADRREPDKDGKPEPLGGPCLCCAQTEQKFVNVDVVDVDGVPCQRLQSVCRCSLVSAENVRAPTPARPRTKGKEGASC